MELLSEYYSENGQKNAKIFRDDTTYVVEILNNYSRYFSEEDAENFAEDWVMKNE